MRTYTERQLVEHYDKLRQFGFLLYVHNTNIPLSEEMFVEFGIRGERIDMVRQRSNGTFLECSAVIGQFDIGNELL